MRHTSRSQSETDLPDFQADLAFQLWARQDLNLQPTDYESAALTRLSYGPLIIYMAIGDFGSRPPS